MSFLLQTASRRASTKPSGAEGCSVVARREAVLASQADRVRIDQRKSRVSAFTSVSASFSRLSSVRTTCEW